MLRSALPKCTCQLAKPASLTWLAGQELPTMRNRAAVLARTPGVDR
jgi:hypothetical protein